MLSIQELRSSSKNELQDELSHSRKEVMKTRMGVRTKHTKDTSLVQKQEHYIAQIMTILKEMALEDEVKNANKL